VLKQARVQQGKKQEKAKSSTNTPSSSRGQTSSSRKTNKRKASSSRKGNLASELLDMLLSDSDNEFNASGSEEDSSDENWK